MEQVDQQQLRKRDTGLSSLKKPPNPTSACDTWGNQGPERGGEWPGSHQAGGRRRRTPVLPGADGRGWKEMLGCPLGLGALPTPTLGPALTGLSEVKGWA